jgi:hypothetical protein
VFRATISLAEPASAAVLERGFRVTWEPPGTQHPEVRLEALTVTEVTAFIDALRLGKINFEMIRNAAPPLGYLLSASYWNGFDPIDLVAVGTTTPLTEIPWEAAKRDSGAWSGNPGVDFERLLASAPICRLVPASAPDVPIAKYRPRLLVCISNPPGIDGGQIEIGPIQTACEQALRAYPVFHVKKLAGPVIWPEVGAAIHSFQPNILLVVGHGSSDPGGGNPTLAFVRPGDLGGVDRVPVHNLAEALSQARSCCLVALIACDLVRSSGHSAACEVVKGAVAEVLAMQGRIEQGCAQVVLQTFLSEVLAGVPVASAAAAARRAAKDHPHAILPAVFRASDRSHGPSELAPLSTLYAQALGALYARASETRQMLDRETLRKSVEDILSKNGVAAVGGAFGNGTSTALRAAVRSSLTEPLDRKSRPVLYIDCDRRLPDVSLSQWVSEQLRTALTGHSVLRPINAGDFIASPGDGYQVGAWAVHAEVSVVLDNLPFRPNVGETAFIEGVCRAFNRKDISAVLVLGGAGELLQLAGDQSTVDVPVLTQVETERYAKDFVPGVDGEELYRHTGGTLLLLDEARLGIAAGRQWTMQEGSANTIDLYLDRLSEWLSAEAREAAARLALFRYAMDLRLIEDFVTPDLPGALAALLNAGLAMSFEDKTITWLVIPEQKSRGIQKKREADQEEIESRLAERFLERYHNKGNATVREAASFAGASEYLKVIQRCLAASGSGKVAVFLALAAQGTALPARGLFALFKQSIRILEQAEFKDGARLAEVFLAGARVALNIGESEVAEAWFRRIPENIDRAIECRRLGLEAAILKDKRQANSLPEILDCFSKAMALMQEMKEEEGDLADVRHELVFDSLPTALFLAHEPAQSAESRLAPVLSAVSPPEKAHLLATLAEREMKEPSDKVAWRKVAEWVTEAGTIVEKEGDERTRTYCLYQQAQYLRKRQNGRPTDAWRIYEKARTAGKLAGEPRREGLALLRLIELERDVPGLREDAAAWPSARRRELDRIAAQLSLSKGDALSLRVLGRLQILGAGFEGDVDSKRRRLTEAAEAFAVGLLSSKIDNRMLAEVSVAILNLDLGSGGQFLLAQRFLSSLYFEIDRRFKVIVDLDHPEAARDKIAEWLNQAA